ncbi:MAG: VanZ family protein [Bacillota bacterium]
MLPPSPAQKKLLRMITIIAFGLYIFVLLYLTVLQRLYRGIETGLLLENYKIDWSLYIRYSVNIIPFKTIHGYLFNSPSVQVTLTNIAGNVIAFIPLGFLAPIVYKQIKSCRSIIIIIASTSVALEFTQFLLKVGSADIDDVILNLAGGLIGYFIFNVAKSIFRPRLPGSTRDQP